MEEKRMTMAIISGAAHALKYKEENPKSSDHDAIQHVTDNAKEIISKIDEEL